MVGKRIHESVCESITDGTTEGDAYSRIITHIHYQISNTNVGTSNHSICKISLDGNCIPKSKEMSFLRKIIHIDLCSNNDFCGNDIDSDLDVKVIHFGFNVRVVFDHGTTNLPVCPSVKRQNECKI